MSLKARQGSLVAVGQRNRGRRSGGACRMTTTQRELLVGALANDGVVRGYAIRRPTLDALRLGGLIQKGLAVIEPAERRKIEAERDRIIQKATELLNGGKWKAALVALGMAQDEDQELLREVYRITDAGRKAVERAA